MGGGVTNEFSITVNGAAQIYSDSAMTQNITGAAEGETVYVRGMNTITSITSSPSVTFTQIGGMQYSFVMPASNIIITVTVSGSSGGTN